MNLVVLIGNLANDPEMRMSQSGKPLTNFRLAVQRTKPNAQGVREADFFPVLTFGKTAEFADKYLRKGAKVCVEGRIQTRSYDAQDGSKRWVTEVLADHVESLARPQEQAQEAAQAEPQPQQGFTDVTADVEDELPF